MLISRNDMATVILPVVQKAKGSRLDANETARLTKELNAQEAVLYEEDYAEQLHRVLIPVDTSLSPGSKTASIKIRSRVGAMRIISNGATVLPLMGFYDREEFVQVRTLGGEIFYSSDDLLHAAETGRPLETDHLITIRQAHRQGEADIVWQGAEDFNIVGLFDNADIPTVALPNGAGASPLWTLKTPQEIINDLNLMVRTAQTNVNRLVKLDTLLMPGSDYDYIAQTPYSTLNTATILDVFKQAQNSHGITLIQPMPGTELTDRFVGGTESGMFLYQRKPETLALKVAMDLTVFPVQAVGLNFRLPAKARVAGVHVKKPQRCLIATGQS